MRFANYGFLREMFTGFFVVSRNGIAGCCICSIPMFRSESRHPLSI